MIILSAGFFSILCFGSSDISSNLARRAQELNLHQEKKWLKMLHYQPSFWGGYKSLADGGDFFSSPEGKTEPAKELEATLHSFFTPVDEMHIKREEIVVVEKPEDTLKPFPQHPICRFPARLRFLKERLRWNGEGLPTIQCKRYQHFEERVKPVGVSFVFSSYFLGNPSSAFGHTFLRILNGNFNTHDRNELLDTGVNFAANPSTTNPLLYALYGMMGLFPGTFTAIPYYYKVREYNDYESRDLWSYQLNFSQTETQSLLEHLWEEGSTYYDYFYFTENCSSKMLDLLEVVSPKLNLSARVPFYVIPSDTVRAVIQEPGFVVGHQYRPSLRVQFEHRLESLDANEKEMLDRCISLQDIPENFDSLKEESKVRVLDTWSDYVEFKFAKQILNDDSKILELKQKVLLARSRLRVKSEELKIVPHEFQFPDRAHASGRLAIALGYTEKDRNLLNVEYRFALHDLTDPELGYPQNMKIEFGSVSAQYFLDRKYIELEKITLFDLASLPLWGSYNRPWSFGGGISIRKDYESDFVSQERYFIANATGFWGSTFPILKNRLSLSTLISGKISFCPFFQDSSFRVDITPRVLILGHFSPYMKALLSFDYGHRFLSADPLRFQIEGEFKHSFGGDYGYSLYGRKNSNLYEAGIRIHSFL